MSEIVTYGEWKDGQLILLKRDDMMRALRNWDNCPIKLTIEKDRKRRSDAQSAWYWGVIIPIICDAINDLQGELAFSRSDIHEYLKQKFNTKIVLSDNGEEIRIAASTSKLNTMEFSAYCESVRAWAVEMLDVEIPDPDKDFDRKPRKRKKQDDSIFIQGDL